jgi:hypothetical protein
MISTAVKKVGNFPTECPLINDVIALVISWVAG